MKTQNFLDKKFEDWLTEKIDILCFEHKNPFTDIEIESWSRKTAERIIYVITPDYKINDKKHQKLCDEIIIKIKDVHGII